MRSVDPLVLWKEAAVTLPHSSLVNKTFCITLGHADVHFGSNVQSYNSKKKPSLTGFQDLPVLCRSINICCVLYFSLLLFSALLPGQL